MDGHEAGVSGSDRRRPIPDERHVGSPDDERADESHQDGGTSSQERIDGRERRCPGSLRGARGRAAAALADPGHTDDGDGDERSVTHERAGTTPPDGRATLPQLAAEDPRRTSNEKTTARPTARTAMVTATAKQTPGGPLETCRQDQPECAPAEHQSRHDDEDGHEETREASTWRSVAPRARTKQNSLLAASGDGRRDHAQGPDRGRTLDR